MIVRRIILSSLSLAIAAIPAQAALAQATGITAGTLVKDVNGGQVGTIVSVDGDHVLVKTDRHEARLPKTSFTATESGLLFGMTQAELNAAIEEAKVNPLDLLKAGAIVRGPAGGTVGMVEAVEGDLVIVKLANQSVKLPVTAFGAREDGLVIGMTAAELEAQLTAAAETK